MDGSGFARAAAGLVCLVLVVGSLLGSKPEAQPNPAPTNNGGGSDVDDPELEAAIRSALESALKDAATAQESWRTAHSSYTDDVNRLAQEGLNIVPQIQFTIVSADRNGYCMNAAYPEEELFYFYSSEVGAPQEGSC